MIRWLRPREAAAGFLFLACLLTSGAEARAQWPSGTRVEDTPHNLTVPARATDPDMSGLVEDYGEVCVYCHGPHGAATDRPLWNRRTPSGPYRMYEDTQMIADVQPSGNSLSCLSCHDGTIGLDEVTRTPTHYSGSGAARTTIDECEGCHSGGSPAGGISWEGVWLDTDLRKQHPISILYDPARATGFRSVAEVEAAGLELYSGKVQCMTCHEPHSQQNRPFLRIPNTGGGLCLACHRSGPGESTAHHW